MVELDDQLERLLAPVSPKTFFATYWERRPLLIRGAPDKFAHLAFSFDVLRAIGRNPSDAQTCKAWRRDQPELPIDPGAIKRHYDAGRSVCLGNVHLRHDPLLRCAAALKAMAGLAQQVGFACYVSPSDAGTGLHCDSHEVFVLQLEGEKQWDYARAPAVAFPVVGTNPGNPATLDHFIAVHGPEPVRIPKPRELVRTVLRPGDLLYLPAGAFHATHAEHHSLALTLGCVPRSVGSIVGEAIERAFRDRREWRRNPPPVHAPGTEESIDDVFRGRIAELARWLASVDVDELVSAWRARAADFPWDPPAARVGSNGRAAPRPPARRASTVTDRETRLVRRWPVTASRLRRTGAIEVLAANRVFTVPRRHHRLVDGLASHVQFLADDVRRWGRCPWATAKAFVELMVQHGIVDVA